MGLDASVMCDCFRTGKTTPPPFPNDWLEIRADGYPDLKKQYNSDENWVELYTWQQVCCEHEGMDLVFEHISNWSGYRQFQAALAEIGWGHFPVLYEQLPNWNGGLTPPPACAKALAEVDVFASFGEIGKKTVLVNTATGDGLYEYTAAYDGIFIRSGRHAINVGLSEFEFFAEDANSRGDLFRATRFRQFNKRGEKIIGDADDVVWQDLDTGNVYESGVAISGKQIPWEDGSWQQPNGLCRFEYPSEFHVEQRPRLVADFEYIVQALRKVFAASIQIGNPACWR